MSEANWYYAEEGETTGPVSREELGDRVRLGRLDASTLVWTEGMEGWVALGELTLYHEILEPRARFETPPPAAAELRPRATLRPSPPDPWRRFLARQLDLLIFQFMVLHFWAVPSRPAEAWQLALMFAAIYFSWAFIEALLMAFLGATPGKWLMRIQVTDLYGRPLRLVASFRRAFDVTLRGQAAGVSPIMAFAMLFGMYRLLGQGVTPWDRSCGTVVTHDRLELWRWLVMVGMSIWLLRLDGSLA